MFGLALVGYRDRYFECVVGVVTSESDSKEVACTFRLCLQGDLTKTILEDIIYLHVNIK